MGLSRRQFSREFKLAALQRLERGSSVGEVARAFEIIRACSIAGGKSFGKGQGTRFPERVSDGGESRPW